MFKKAMILGAGLFAVDALAAKVQLTLELDGLEPMKGQHFEGWNIVNGKAESTGRFAIAANGEIYQVNAAGQAMMRVGKDGKATFAVEARQAAATTFVLTIEPNGDMDPAPSPVHVMGGDYNNQATELSIAHGSSIGDNFSTSEGSYILAAPTGGTPDKGVWFVDPAAGAGSLQLPTLPDGWAYEGWIVNTENGGKLSTGLFTSAQGADSDGAGLYAGPLKLSFPPVPGQDIVATPISINDGKHAIVVTVEPYPDYDPAPFALKVLKGDVYGQAPGMTPMQMDNIAGETAPRGKAHIH